MFFVFDNKLNSTIIGHCMMQGPKDMGVYFSFFICFYINLLITLKYSLVFIKSSIYL